MRLLSFLGVAATALLLSPGSAQAIPIVSSDPSAVASLTPGTATITLTLSITPDSDGVKGFALFFDVSDAASIVVQGCSSPVDPAPVCSPGGTSFNFAVLDFTPAQTTTFVAGSVDLEIPSSASLGAALTLAGNSTITEGNFSEVILSQTLVAQVVPEPNTAALVVIGFAAFAVARRP